MIIETMLKKYAPALVVVASIILCLASFRLYLVQSSQQLGLEFKAQNAAELSSSDTYALASRLNFLSSAIHWSCLKGVRKDQSFFEKAQGYCGPLPWQQVITIQNTPTNDVQITISLRLPTTLELGCIGFILLQFLLLVSLLQTTRAQERERHEVLSAKLKAEADLGKLAAQVSHDIRSPLASLQSVIYHTQGLKEETRTEIREAVNRIRDIANGLLNQGKKTETSIISDETPSGFSTEALSTEWVAALVDPIISEKRNQHRGLNIEFDSSSGYGLFSSVQPIEFRRVLSNLLNNSIEALNPQGKLSVQISQIEDSISIRIHDNGKGMPPEVLAKLGQRGFSSGKEGTESGSGLGVAHAMNTVQAWRGSLKYESEVGKGTTAIITLPLATPPRWFTQELIILPGATVIVVDDDQGIHSLWKSRISDVTFLDFYSGDELIKWFRQTYGMVESPVYLFDYELIGSNQTGLDLIDMIGSSKDSILITSRWNEASIRERCQRFGIRLLPKSMAPFIPIKQALASGAAVEPNAINNEQA